MSKEIQPNIYFTILTCPNCKANVGIAIDLRSDDNVLRCKKCGTETEIDLNR